MQQDFKSQYIFSEYNLESLVQVSTHFQILRRYLLRYLHKPCKNLHEIYLNLHYKDNRFYHIITLPSSPKIQIPSKNLLEHTKSSEYCALLTMLHGAVEIYLQLTRSVPDFVNRFCCLRKSSSSNSWYRCYSKINLQREIKFVKWRPSLEASYFYKYTFDQEVKVNQKISK